MNGILDPRLESGPQLDHYDLIDCGNGRRLERFADVVTDRPAPAAGFPPALPESEWARARLSFHRDNGWQGSAPDDWRVAIGSATLHLRPGSGGQIGIFPEHASVISRLESLISRTPMPPGGWRILNLFAHTGLATLRLAALEAVGEVVHLDAAPSAVALAKLNAEASGLGEARIRWIADDALAFLAKEARRDRKYHLILADPPAFGRNRKSGKEWKLERDLPDLISRCGRLAGAERFAFCLTCHKPGWDGKRLAGMLHDAIPGLAAVETRDIRLRPLSGGSELPCGCAAMGN